MKKSKAKVAEVAEAVGPDRVCTTCGLRLKAEHVLRSRHLGEPLSMHALIDHVRRKQGDPLPEEQECHRVWLPSGRTGVGHWMEYEGRCGPLRAVNAQDDYLEQLGVKEGR